MKQKTAYLGLFSAVAILTPALLAGFRDSGIGTDTEIYVDDIWNQFKHINSWGQFYKYYSDKDFDDIEFVMYQVKDLLWNIDYYSVTADPSRETLLTLPNKLGAAIIVPGQYKQCWKLGFHNGKSDHPALVQIRPINVIRDFNKDTKLDADIITDKNKYIFNTTTTQFGSITYVVEKSTNKTVQIINFHFYQKV